MEVVDPTGNDKSQGRPLLKHRAVKGGGAAPQANPITARHSCVNGYIKAGNNDNDDDNDELPFKEVLLNVKRKRANPSRKRKITQDHDIKWNSEDSNFASPQKRHRSQAPSPAASPRRVEIIDLTGNAEYCATCSNILGQGNDSAARIYIFSTCRCVVCGECLLNSAIDVEHKITIGNLWCPRNDHFNRGKQKARELFGIECLICSENAADKFDRTWREGTADKVDRIRTPCGHAFCRSCISDWIKATFRPTCPICRSKLGKDPAKFRSFETVQRGVVCETNLGC